ncbi:MAG: cupin domain-containing protein [Candidatus Eisenbacteria bacterium]|nr:cupin domain-containing protein [Candidatus Eisenbacteria bacterium]
MRDQDTAQVLGRRVRRVRQEQGLTLREIESRSGVSATHISEVERGKTSPTVGVLERIGEALGVRSTDLLGPNQALLPLFARPAERRRRSFSEGAVVEVLTQPHGPCCYSACVVTLPPEALFQTEPGHPGEELCHVLEGAIEVSHGEIPYVVTAGESLQFRATSRHGVRNASGSPARFLWIASPRAAL